MQLIPKILKSKFLYKDIRGNRTTNSREYG